MHTFHIIVGSTPVAGFRTWNRANDALKQFSPRIGARIQRHHSDTFKNWRFNRDVKRRSLPPVKNRPTGF